MAWSDASFTGVLLGSASQRQEEGNFMRIDSTALQAVPLGPNGVGFDRSLLGIPDPSLIGAIRRVVERDRDRQGVFRPAGGATVRFMRKVRREVSQLSLR